MENLNLLSQQTAILLILGISIIFVIIGTVYSNQFKGLNNYLLANRSVGTFSLTTSLVASALGAWILFGPASAATWGGIGAVIGYSLNDSIVVFDRIRENNIILRKLSILDVLDKSINQTLSRTLVTSLTTLLVIISLLIFGGDAVKNFSIAMFIGIIVGTYSSIFVASTSLSYFGIQRPEDS